MQDVVEINKIELGKMIRDYTGNEGSNENPDLCRLLQTCLDFLQTESKPIWKNASFTIYDPEENMYKITSGTRRHQFICRMKNGEPFIMKKKKHRQIRNEFPFQCPLLWLFHCKSFCFSNPYHKVYEYFVHCLMPIQDSLKMYKFVCLFFKQTMIYT